MIAAILAPALVALTVPCNSPVDDPVSGWVERELEVESIEAKFIVRPSSGTPMEGHIYVEGRDKAVIRMEQEGEHRLGAWFDGASYTILVPDPEGELTWASYEIENLLREPILWIESMRSTLDGTEHDADLSWISKVNIWPDLASNKITAGLSCGSDTSNSRFKHLEHLQDGAYEFEETPEGRWRTHMGDKARLECEPVLGLPSGIWFDEEDGERHAYELTSLLIDGELPEDFATAPDPPEDSTDRSFEMRTSAARLMWNDSRRVGYDRIRNALVDDDEAIDDDQRQELIEAFEAWHLSATASAMESLLARERAVLDQALLSLEEWFEENKEHPQINEGLDAARTEFEASLGARLDGLEETYAESFSTDPLASASDVTEGIFEEFERAGIDRALESCLRAPLLEAMEERLDELR